MKSLRAYRACSWAEKRTILSFYWSTREAPSPALDRAAREYAPWATLLASAIWLELLFVTFYFVGRQSNWAAVGSTATSLWTVGVGWSLYCQSVIVRRVDAHSLGS